VLLCSCINPDENKRLRIRNAAIPSLNWDLVYDISIHQRTFPLVYENILTFLSGNVPTSLIGKLKVVYHDNLRRNFFLSSILTKLLRLFEENKVKVIPFKGPVLSENIYGDIGRRCFSDLDILVSRADVLPAWNLFIKNGFEPEITIGDELIKQYVNNEDNISFRSRGANVTVELHWELSGNYLSQPLVFEQMSRRLTTIIFNKERVLSLSNEHLLLYLCIHGAKHEWEYLELVCCIAEVIKNPPNLDWGMIDDCADQWRCRMMLDLGLYLAWMLLDVSIPEMIQKRIRTQRILNRLTQTVIKKMFQKHRNKEFEDKSSRFSRFHVDVRDSFADKLRYVLRLVFSPSKREWELFPLPRHLFFLRYFFRPFRLISQRIKMKAEEINAERA
jgi:hypothetical protein